MSPDQTICIIGGAGHVGLPLSLTFASRGFRVCAVDPDRSRLDCLMDGRLPFHERGGAELLEQALAESRIEFSQSLRDADLSGISTFVITIGTPIDEFMNPELEVMAACADELLPFLEDDGLVVLRSTVYPGTTEWMHTYLESRGASVKLAYCPERVVQGNAIEEIQQLPQIVSGVTRDAEKSAAKLFERIAKKIVYLSPMEAEFSKLFSNAYRYIQFAISNQFYMIADAAGVDYNRILSGMKDNYERAKEIPSAGFSAGPCLLKDSMQLAAFSNNQFTLGHSAMLVNEGLVLYLAKAMEEQYGPLASKTVGLLGMAFKAESDDVRSSLSYKLKKVLRFGAQRVLTTDPYVKDDPDLVPLERVLEESDVLVVCAPHRAYRDLAPKQPVVDIWNHIERAGAPSR